MPQGLIIHVSGRDPALAWFYVHAAGEEAVEEFEVIHGFLSVCCVLWSGSIEKLHEFVGELFAAAGGDVLSLR